MNNNFEFKTNHIKKENVVITSHTPFLLLGKFSDFTNGNAISCNIKELKFCSICSKYKDNKVLIYNKKEKIKFNSKDFNNAKFTPSLNSSLLGLIYELESRFILKNFDGLVFSYDTNINKNEGLELNLLINFIESINILYELKMDLEFMAKLIHYVYSKYFDKKVPLLYVYAFFQDGISYLNFDGNKFFVKTITDNLDRYGFVRFINGNALNKVEFNSYYNSLYNVYDKLKNVMHVNNLEEIDIAKNFNYLFSPYSPLVSYEQLVITHYFEESKRCKSFLESYTDKDVTSKLFDSINTSNYEVGAFLSFNRFKNYLEANVYKANFNKSLALTTLNPECTNSFMFICKNYEINSLISHLNTLQNYKFHVCNISQLGLEININK